MTDAQKIAAIVGITEAIKQYGLPSKFAPTVAIIIGAAIGYSEKQDIQGVIEGVLWGASVTGGYAVVKRSGSGIISPLKRRSDADNLEPDDYRGI